MNVRQAAWMPFALSAFVAARAAAHPAPATPPTFAPGECITVVDTRVTQALELKYDVAIDDNVFGDGEIRLADAKSHQFFAFDGVVSRNATADGYQLFPFDAGVSEPLALPLWLDQSDVDRAADAATPLDMTGFTASQVDAGNVLATRPDVGAYVHAIGGTPARVPITKRQAEKGVHWDLSAAVPGLYSVVGYVFSPPYNDWAARAGVIKVVDGGSGVPAAVIDPIDKTLFAGQGRRVRGCVAAPVGSTLSAWVRAEDQPNAPWEAWLERAPLAEIGKDGSFELCFLNRAPGRSGVLRVRVEVSAPDGQRSAAYSPDTLLAVATPAPCTAGEDTCCEQSAPAVDAGGEPAALAPADAGSRNPGAQVEAGQAPDAGQAPPASPPAPSAVGDAERGGGGGCAVLPGETREVCAPALVLFWAVAWRMARRRARGAAPQAPSPIG